MRVKKISDAQLIKGLLNKDEHSLYVFFNRYSKPLSLFIKRQIKDARVVEEIVQDVFIEFLESLRSYRSEASLKTFLFSIARYKTIDVIRKKKVKKILFSALSPRFVEGLKTILIDEEIESNELQEKILSVFNKLPNDYARILRLKYMEGVSVKDIAEKMSLKFKAAESLLFRARKAFVTVYNQPTI